MIKSRKILAGMLAASMLFSSGCNSGYNQNQDYIHEVVNEVPELTYTMEDYLGGYSDFVIINEKKNGYLYVSDLKSEDDSSERIEYEAPEDMYFHLEVEKGYDEDEVINSFKYVELTKEGVDELMSHGACNAFVCYGYDEYSISQVVFYTEKKVDKRVNYREFFKDKNLNTKQELIGTHWINKGYNGFLTFNENGNWSYGDFEEPLASSDMYPKYEYNEKDDFITVYSKKKDKSSVIKIVEHTKDKLVLKMSDEMGGGTHSFKSEEDMLISPCLPLGEGDYAELQGLIKITDCDKKGIKLDVNADEYGGITNKMQFTEDTNFFIMDEVAGYVNRNSLFKYRYMQITKEGAIKLLKKSDCSAWIGTNGDGYVSKIVFYPLGKADQ